MEFQSKKVKNRIRLFFLAFSVAIAFSFIVVESIVFDNPVTKVAQQLAVNKSIEREKVFNRFLQKVELELNALYESSAFQQLSSDPLHKQRLVDQFISVIHRAPEVMQIRFIDVHGHEVARVDKLGFSGEVRVVSEDKLQNKSGRYYFQDAKKQPLEQVSFSALDLNIENGEVQKPFLPTLRAILPSEQDGQFNGILIINLNMDAFLQRFMDMPLFNGFLLNNQGHLLAHHDKTKSWAQHRDSGLNLKDVYPDYADALENAEPIQDNGFFFRPFHTPIKGGLGLGMELKPSFIDGYRYNAILEYALTFLIVIVLSIGLSQVLVVMFSKFSRMLNALQSLSDTVNETSKIAKIGFWDYQADSDQFYFSDSAYAIFEIDDLTQAMSMEQFLRFIPNTRKYLAEKSAQQSRNAEKPYHLTYQLVTAKGHKRIIEERGHHFYDKKGKMLRSSGSFIDITQKQQYQEQLDAQRKKYQTIINSGSDAVVLLNSSGDVIEANDKASKYLGYSLTELQTLSIFDFDVELTEDAFDEYKQVMDEGFTLTEERTHYRKDGCFYEAEIAISCIEIGLDSVIHASIRDITERKHIQKIVHEQKDQLQAIFDNALEGIALVNIDYTLSKVNKNFAEIMGHSVSDLVGQSLIKYVNPENHSKYEAVFLRCLDQGFYQNFERKFTKNDGTVTWLKSSLVLMPDRQQVLMTTVDYTELKKIQTQLIESTYCDELTKLRNRKAYNEKVVELAIVNKTQGVKLSLIVFDIDNFKKINDQYGHSVGDDVLVTLSAVVSSVIRSSDHFYRLGGEEFVILVQGSDVQEASVLAEKVRKSVDETKFEKAGHVSVSVGLAELQENETEDELFIRADNLMYQSKTSGKNKVSL